MPKWMQAVDTFSAGKALGLGAILSGLNPKNLALTVAAATAIAQTSIRPPRKPALSPSSSSLVR